MFAYMGRVWVLGIGFLVGAGGMVGAGFIGRHGCVGVLGWFWRIWSGVGFFYGDSVGTVNAVFITGLLWGVLARWGSSTLVAGLHVWLTLVKGWFSVG